MRVADTILPIKPIDINSSRLKCIEIMLDNRCIELPVMKESKLYGTLELDECIHSQDDTIISIVESGFSSIHYNTHLYDVLNVFSELKSTVCVVLDDNLEWLGIVTQASVINSLCDSLTTSQIGSILIIEMAAHQYSSSEISRIIESEGSQILGLWLNNVKESGRIRASIKINTQNAERIVNSLLRFNYEVIATFGDDDYQENVEKRFKSLIKYIDL